MVSYQIIIYLYLYEIKIFKMKKTRVILLICFLLVIAKVQSQDLYPAVSGKIVYNYEINDTKSIYTFWFDQHGKRQIIDIKNLDDATEHVKTVITPKYMLVINYDEQQAMKIPQGAEKMGTEAGEGFNMTQLLTEIKSNDPPAHATETINGKACQVYAVNDLDGTRGKYWVWNGYLMKADIVVNNGEHAFMQVKDVQLEISIDEAEFTYPADFMLNDMTPMMEQMKKMQELYGVPDGE